MRIAVVGTGIAGLATAHALREHHDLRLFEAGDYAGGHTATVDVAVEGRELAVDTGFIVFNERTYPRFCNLLRDLGVDWQDSCMSFSARVDSEDVEYAGTPRTLFAQRRNLVRPRFLRMVLDIRRFYREARGLLAPDAPDVTLGQFLREGNYSRAFVDWHLVPMVAAVWSAGPRSAMEMPARFLVRFFENHGFLDLRDRPQWLAVRGGSREYVRRLLEPMADRLHLRTPVESVRRTPQGVELRTATGDVATFDRVVLATHGDTARKILADPSPLEREVLAPFRTQANEVLLHTDPSVMPRRRRAWSSWNVQVGSAEASHLQATYWMNRLQSLDCATDLFVSLNAGDEIDPSRVLRRFSYRHPIFTPDAVAAQARHAEIDGSNGVHFAGAYWRNGFHEDGVESAAWVCRNLLRARRAA